MTEENNIEIMGILPNGETIGLPLEVQGDNRDFVYLYPLRGKDSKTMEIYPDKTFITDTGFVITPEGAVKKYGDNEVIATLPQSVTYVDYDEAHLNTREMGATYGAKGSDIYKHGFQNNNDILQTVFAGEKLVYGTTDRVDVIFDKDKSWESNTTYNAIIVPEEGLPLGEGVKGPNVSAGDTVAVSVWTKDSSKSCIISVFNTDGDGNVKQWKYEAQANENGGFILNTATGVSNPKFLDPNNDNDKDIIEQLTAGGRSANGYIITNEDTNNSILTKTNKDTEENRKIQAKQVEQKRINDLKNTTKNITGFQQAREILRGKSENLESWYEKLLNATLVWNNPRVEGQNQVVDVLNNFGWTYNSFNGGGYTTNSQDNKQYAHKASVPYLYVIEYQQMYSSGLTNLINQFAAIANALPEAGEGLAKLYEEGTNLASKLPILGSVFKTVGELVSSVGESINTRTEEQKEKGDSVKEELSLTGTPLGTVRALVYSVGSFVSNLAHKVDNMYQNSPIGDSTLLHPYKWLYAVRPTGNCYVFPFLTSSASQYKIVNSWADSEEAESLILNNALTKAVQGFSQIVSAAANDLTKLFDFIDDAKTDGANIAQNRGTKESSIETAQFFKFNKDGEEVSISFPLYNTLKKGQWKDHYHFIFNFALRNLPFRLDNMSYKVPLLYDLVVPGFKRLPICYVAEFSATPQGIIHVMSMNTGFIDQYKGNGADLSTNDKTIAVYVPEAWNITIKFKSLVSSTANTLLSALVDTQISVESKTSNS